MHVIPPVERRVYEQAIASVRAGLSAEDFTASFRQGQAMETAQAIRYALDEPDWIRYGDPSRTW